MPVFKDPDNQTDYRQLQRLEPPQSNYQQRVIFTHENCYQEKEVIARPLVRKVKVTKTLRVLLRKVGTSLIAKMSNHSTVDE